MLGDSSNRIEVTSDSSFQAFFDIVLINEVQELDISGLILTPAFLEILSFRLSMSQITSLKITIDNEEFLEKFASESVLFPSNLKQIAMVLEHCKNRIKLVNALHSLLLSRSGLESLQLDGWGLTDQELEYALFGLTLHRLTTLSLSQNNITERSLLHLAAEKSNFLRNVITLNFSHNQIQTVPQPFLFAANKPNLSLDLTHNNLSQQQIEYMLSCLPQRKSRFDATITVLPQKVAMNAPEEFFDTEEAPITFTQIYKKKFNVTSTYCEFPGEHYLSLTNEMVRSLIFHHANGSIPSTEEEVKKALGEIFIPSSMKKTQIRAALPAPYRKPPREDTFINILSDEETTPPNASLRLWHLVKSEPVLDLSEVSITSVPALLGLVELLSHPDGPVKELILGPIIADLCWEVLASHFHRIRSIVILNYFEIPAQKMRDLHNLGKPLLARLEGINFSGPPVEGFIDILLPILRLAPLKYLDVSCRKIGDEGARALLNVCQPGSLVLDESGITDDGFELICLTYAQKGNLIHLQLDDNPITSPTPLLQLHHLQPLTLSMPSVRFSTSKIIAYYDELLKVRKEGYIEQVKHDFCYPVYSINTGAAIIVRQFLLNVRGCMLPLLDGTEELNPYLEIMHTLWSTPQITQETLNRINTHPDHAYFIGPYLSRFYTTGLKTDDLLDILCEEMNKDKEALREQLNAALPDSPHLDEQTRYLLALKKIDPYPLFLFDKDSRFTTHQGVLYPAGEYATLHYPIILYRTQEGMYYQLIKN